jgi:hypothetical protein
MDVSLEKYLSDECVMIGMDKYNIIVYGCLGSIILWAILKALGVFNTPVIIEVFPLIAGAVAAGIGFGKFGTTLKHIDSRTKRIVKEISPIKDRLTKIETTCKIHHKK